MSKQQRRPVAPTVVVVYTRAAEFVELNPVPLSSVFHNAALGDVMLRARYFAEGVRAGGGNVIAVVKGALVDA